MWGDLVHSSVSVRSRALAAALSIGVVFASALAMAAPSPASAAPCVKFVASNWDAPGDDNYMPQLNQEWVRIKNTCAKTQALGGWKIHDYGKKHTYTFPSAFKIGPGVSVTLRSGKGTNSSTTRYWQRSYGAVWNNSAPEKAYLRNGSGTLIHSWVQRGW